MSENIIEVYPYGHDFEITLYQVDINNHRLQIYAEYKKEKICMTFTGLLAHKFEYVIDSNIIFDITQISVDYFIDSYKEELEESLPYGFPVSIKTCEELREHLKEEGQKVFEICSSLGLAGFVIAKEISMEVISE